jgi:hypothetical protein
MANTFLVGIENFRRKYGKAVRPSDDKIDSEICITNTIFSKIFIIGIYGFAEL